MIENRTIFTGDNLDIMPGMDSESVDLIYLDPPFNSNRHYQAPVGSKAAGAAFKDAWTFEDTDEAWWGLIAEEHPALYKIIDAVGAIGNSGDKSYLIYMAMRILEMHRILKSTGSIYLHCDDTMGHSLKLVMDAIFGKTYFANDITWKRTTAHSDGKRFGRNTDTLLFYHKSRSFTWNPQFEPYGDEYLARFKHQDSNGRRWTDDNLSAKGLSGGGYEYSYKGASSLWRLPESRMKELDAQNRLHFTSRGGIRLKRYLDEAKGLPLQSAWNDISPINSQAKEKTGYPTQKPLALLERIIKVSSNEGDMVFDPFCGCATTLIAAEKENRQWIGIDISPKAVDLVRDRLHQTFQIGKGSEGELALKSADVIHRTDVPIRLDHVAPRSKNIKHILFGKQDGICNGCKHDFPFQNFTLDHIQPTSRGGPNTDANLQLLCGHCNSVKSNGTMPELIARLRERGILH